MKKGTKKPKPISTAAKPPADPWDALGWIRFIRDWKHDWPHPGGLDRDWFANRFMLAIVPQGWIKPGYGSLAGAKGRKDIGYGHAAFFQLFTAGTFESPDAIMAADFRPFQKALASAFIWGRHKPNFFSDFQQAWDMMRKCQASNKPLLFADVRRHEYFALVAMLEDPRPTYTVAELRKLVARRFPTETPTWAALDKVMTRLDIAKPKRGK